MHGGGEGVNTDIASQVVEHALVLPTAACPYHAKACRLGKLAVETLLMVVLTERSMSTCPASDACETRRAIGRTCK